MHIYIYIYIYTYELCLSLLSKKCIGAYCNTCTCAQIFFFRAWAYAGLQNPILNNTVRLRRKWIRCGLSVLFDETSIFTVFPIIKPASRSHMLGQVKLKTQIVNANNVDYQIGFCEVVGNACIHDDQGDREKFLNYNIVNIRDDHNIKNYSMDGGIDLIGEHRGVKFVVQCKNFTEDKVNASLVRDFIGGLSIYPPDTSKMC
ncbi:unnamed protein product [Rhizophagus irregularis]|nr:unnamed protein product [Rhizophagus irregularis]CAB4419392.1 unnamed protein product [Rhizophagus irregularis]